MHPLEQAQNIFQQMDNQMLGANSAHAGIDGVVALVTQDTKGRSVVLMRGAEANDKFSIAYVAQGQVSVQAGDIISTGEPLFASTEDPVETELFYGLTPISQERAYAYTPEQDLLLGQNIRAKGAADIASSTGPALNTGEHNHIDSLAKLTGFVDPLGMTEAMRSKSDLQLLDDATIYFGMSKLASQLGSCDVIAQDDVLASPMIANMDRNLLMQAAGSLTEDGHVSGAEMDSYLDLMCHLATDATQATTDYEMADVENGQTEFLPPNIAAAQQPQRVNNPLPSK